MDKEYDIESCVEWMSENNYLKIVLQFPEQDLSNSPLIVEELQNRTSVNHEFFIVLTASCGVDFLSPLRLGTNFIQGIICFGSTSGSPCLSGQTCFAEVPVLYLLGKKNLQIDFVRDQIRSSPESLILYDLGYGSIISKLLEENVIKKENVGKVTRLRSSWSFPKQMDDLIVESSETSNRLGIFTLIQPIAAYPSIIWVGQCNDLSYRVNCVKDITLVNPISKEKSTIRPQKELMKRLALIERVKDARTIGLVFTNLLPDVTSVTEGIKKLLIKKRKQFVMISLVQAVDNTKFGNFGEVDAYALSTACACGSFILTTHAHVPLVTETELLISLGVRTFYGGLEWNTEVQVEDEETSEVTSEITSLMEYKQNLNHWFGLEVAAGDTPASDIKQGQTGIASAYDSEPF